VRAGRTHAYKSNAWRSRISQRHVIGQSRRPADGAEKHRVKRPERVEEVLRRDAAVALVMGHPPIEPLELDLKAA
jgi:hypothetical protein